MATRVRALKPGESPDPEVNRILQDAKEGWFLEIVELVFATGMGSNTPPRQDRE